MDALDRLRNTITNRDLAHLKWYDQRSGKIEIPFVERECFLPVIAHRLLIGGEARRRDNEGQSCISFCEKGNLGVLSEAIYDPVNSSM